MSDDSLDAPLDFSDSDIEYHPEDGENHPEYKESQKPARMVMVQKTWSLTLKKALSPRHEESAEVEG
jgi:hypothetical protein